MQLWYNNTVNNLLEVRRLASLFYFKEVNISEQFFESGFDEEMETALNEVLPNYFEEVEAIHKTFNFIQVKGVDTKGNERVIRFFTDGVACEI